MSGEKLWAALGDVRDEYVTEAVEYQKKRRTWVRWAALAACLCLVAGGVLVWRWSRPEGGGAGVPGGGVEAPGGVDVPGDNMLPEGVDPGIASVAQFPATEDIRDVADAEFIDLALDDLGELGTHLPDRLPGGFFLNRADLYHTTMKDGTEYNMLRGSYALEDHLFPTPDGSMEYGESLCVMVYDHRPRVEGREIYTRETLTDYLAGQTETRLLVTFSSGDVYLNIWSDRLTPAQLIDLIDAIP